MNTLNDLQQKALQTYPTYEKFIAEQDPKRLLVNYSDFHEIKDAISIRRITIQEMDEMYKTSEISPGPDYFAKWILFFNKFTNINKGMPTDTIEWVAIQLYSKYCHFYFADLKVIFEHLLESRFGKFYGSVDTVLIMSAFTEYDKHRNRILHKEKEQIEVQKALWRKQAEGEIKQKVWDDLKKKNPDMEYEQLVTRWNKISEKIMQEEERKLFP